MKWKIFLLALLWPSPAVLAQTQPQAELKSLEIGDQIPKEIWEQPFKVINHPDGKEIIRLSDYSGKLIILDRKSTRLNSSHVKISYAVFCLKKKKKQKHTEHQSIRRNL